MCVTPHPLSLPLKMPRSQKSTLKKHRSDLPVILSGLSRLANDLQAYARSPSISTVFEMVEKRESNRRKLNEWGYRQDSSRDNSGIEFRYGLQFFLNLVIQKMVRVPTGTGIIYNTVMLSSCGSKSVGSAGPCVYSPPSNKRKPARHKLLVAYCLEWWINGTQVNAIPFLVPSAKWEGIWNGSALYVLWNED